MSAITWRNIDAPDFTGASRIMGESQKMFDSGFGKLGQIIEQQQKQDQVNAVAERNTNSSKYLDSVAALAQQGPQALEQAIKSGAVNKLRESFGPNIDADRIRGAAEQMLSQRMQQAKQGMEFNNFMVDEAQKPVRDAWRVAGLKGDKETQARLEQENPNLRNMAELYTAQRGIDHENVVWDEDKKEYVRRQGKYDQDIKASNAGIAYQQGMLANAQANTGLARERLTMDKADRKEDRDMRQEERLNKMLIDVQEKYGETFKSNPNSEKSMLAQMDVINKLPEAARELAMAAVTKARAVPGATQGSVLATAMASTAPEYLSTDGGQIKRAVNAGESARLANVASGAELATETRQGLLGNRMKAIQTRLDGLNPELAPKAKSSKEGTPDSRAAKAAIEGRGIGSGNYPIEDVSDEAAERSVKSIRDRVAAETKEAAKTPKTQQEIAKGIASQFGPEADAKRAAEQAEKEKARAAIEQAEKDKRRAAYDTRVKEGEERGARAKAAQDTRYAEIAERRRADKEAKVAANVAQAEAEVRMMEERVRYSGAPVHKANLEDAKEKLRSLTRK